MMLRRIPVMPTRMLPTPTIERGPVGKESANVATRQSVFDRLVTVDTIGFFVRLLKNVTITLCVMIAD